MVKDKTHMELRKLSLCPQPGRPISGGKINSNSQKVLVLLPWEPLMAKCQPHIPERFMGGETVTDWKVFFCHSPRTQALICI